MMTKEQLKEEALHFYNGLWEDVEENKRTDFEQWYKGFYNRIFYWKGWRIKERWVKRSFFKYLKQRKRI